MSPVEGALGFGWIVALGLALRGPKVVKQTIEVEKPAEKLPEVEILEGPEVEGEVFRVVQTTPDGRRARIMWERGTPGRTETLELYHGPECRGRKTGPL